MDMLASEPATRRSSARRSSSAVTWGLEVVAEGVETEEAWEALREQGCTLAQGYLIGKPAPAGALRELLDERAAQRVRLARAS